MKKKYVIILVILIALSSIIYFALFGNPLKKYLLKKQAYDYLQNRYDQKMVVSDVYYDFLLSSYQIKAYPIGQKYLEFNIFYIPEEKSFGDDYLSQYWINEVDSELVPFVRYIYSNQAYAHFDFSMHPIYNVRNKLIIIPSYKDVLMKSVTSVEIFQYPKSNIIIDPKRGFNVDNADQEYDKMLDIIKYIVNQGYQPDDLTFVFVDNSGNILKADKYEINSYSNLQNIKSKDDIIRYKSVLVN